MRAGNPKLTKWLAGAVAASFIASLSGLVELTLANSKLHAQIRTGGLDYLEVRLAVIRSQLSQVEKPIVILGDSLAESAVLPQSICGHPVVNAGISGAGIGIFAKWAPRLLKDIEPTLTILTVGINDVLKGSDEASFQSAYAVTLQSIHSPVAVGTIVATSTPLIDPVEIERFNRAISRLAGDSDTIDLHGAIDGDLTVDGIHLNSEGYRLWTRELLSGAKRAIGCSE